MVWSDAAPNWGSKGQLRGTGCLQQAVRSIPGEELSYINLINIALKWCNDKMRRTVNPNYDFPGVSISKPILHYFGVNSISGLTADRCGTEQSWNRPVFDSASLIWSIGHINGGERTNSLRISVGVTWITNVQIMMSGKSKVLTVKSRTETHFRKTNISRDVSSRHGPNCPNIICKMLLRLKLIRGAQRPFSGKWSEMPHASWSALKAT